MARLGTGGALQGVKEEEMHRGGGVRESMPPDWYRFVCKATTYKPTREGNAMCLHLTHVCLTQSYHGRELRDFLVLEHPKAETVQIAKARLKELAIAVGHPNPNRVQDSAELHNIAFMARLYTQAAKDPKYGDRNGLENRIGEYRACSDPFFKNGAGATAESDGLPAPTEEDAPPPPDDDGIPF